MTQSLAEEQKKTLINQVPLGRLGDVSDIANTVLFLSSDLSKYITGSTIHVNGGMLME
jgi:3-oxoacyl-[acyl-carrier protein] reductase